MFGLGRKSCGCGGGASAERGQLPGGLIGLRTAVGRPDAHVPVITTGWTYNYRRQEKLLHVPTVPPPIVYSAMHPIFIGPESGVQGYTNTGPTSYFSGGLGQQSWPRRFMPYQLPAAFNKISWNALVMGAMRGQPSYQAVLNQPRPWTIPTILQPRGQ